MSVETPNRPVEEHLNKPEHKNAPKMGFLDGALKGLKAFLDMFKEVNKWTQDAFSKLGASLGVSPTEKPKDPAVEKVSDLERVRRVITKNADNIGLQKIAAPAWKTIQEMPAADLHGANRVELWTYMMALAEQESNFDPKVINRRSGAYGLFQIMPANFKEWGLNSGRNASLEEQVRVAAKQLTGYYKYFDKRWDLVSVSWFGGASRAIALAKGNKSVANLKDAGGKSIGAYHEDVAKRMERLQSA